MKIIINDNMLSEISRIEPPPKKNKKHQKAAPKKNTPSWKAPSPDKQMWLQQGVETYFEERGVENIDSCGWEKYVFFLAIQVKGPFLHQIGLGLFLENL